MTNLVISYLTEVIMSTLEEKRGARGRGEGAEEGYILKLSLLS